MGKDAEWELSVGRDAKQYCAGLSIAAVLGCIMERTGRLLPDFLWPGVPPAEWGNQLKLLTRKTEWSLEGKTISIHLRSCGVWGAELCLVVPDVHLAEFCI